MRRLLSCFLVVLIVFGASPRTAFASPEHDASHAAKLKAQVDLLTPGASLKVRLNDHREVGGELLAQTDDGFRISGAVPLDLKYADVKSVTEDPGGQSSPGGASSSKPSHHSHRVIKYVIIFAVAFGLTVALVSLDK